MSQPLLLIRDESRLLGGERRKFPPEVVAELVQAGYVVRVEDFKDHSFWSPADYVAAGAKIVSSSDLYKKAANESFSFVCMTQVKQTHISELDAFAEGGFPMSSLIIYGFHHPSNHQNMVSYARSLEIALCSYDLLENSEGRWPILAQMSKIAGTRIADEAIREMFKTKGRVIADYVSGPRTKVLVVGLGVLGFECARRFSALGADVVACDVSEKARELAGSIGARFVFASDQAIFTEAVASEIVVAAVRSRGEKAAKVIPEKLLKQLKPGTLVFDPSIDEGGATDWSEGRTIDYPWVSREHLRLYCAANIPGSVPVDSSRLLAFEAKKFLLSGAQCRSRAEFIMHSAEIRSGMVFEI